MSYRSDRQRYVSSLYICVKSVYLHSVGVVRKVGALQKWQARVAFVGVKAVYLHSVGVVGEVGALGTDVAGGEGSAVAAGDEAVAVLGVSHIPGDGEVEAWRWFFAQERVLAELSQ